MAALFLMILQSAHKPILIFNWIIIMLMFCNFWYGQNKESSISFFIGMLMMAILMVISILSFIGWLFNVAMFNGFWGKIFGWPSLAWAFIIAMYSMFMLDKEMHEDIKRACREKIKEHAPLIISVSLVILLAALAIAKWENISETYSSIRNCFP
jgi:hypothetical protein